MIKVNKGMVELSGHNSTIDSELGVLIYALLKEKVLTKEDIEKDLRIAIELSNKSDEELKIEYEKSNKDIEELDKEIYKLLSKLFD